MAAFSIPRLKLWLPAAEEIVARNALVQAAAVWGDKQVQQMANGASARAPGSEQSETPTSQAEFERVISNQLKQ